MKNLESFFDKELISDGVELKDLSRMTIDPITKCLTHWLSVQESGMQAFKFDYIWSESNGDFIEAAASGVGSVPEPAVDYPRSKPRKGKEKARPSAVIKEQPSKILRHKNAARPNIATPAGTSLQHALATDDKPFLLEDQYPIDPILQNYPTEGPNDPVPLGYYPAPRKYLPPSLEYPPAIGVGSQESNPPLWAMDLIQKFQSMEQRLQAVTDLQRMDPMNIDPSIPQPPTVVNATKSAKASAITSSSDPETTGLLDPGSMPLETIVASPSTSHTAPPRPRTWPTKSTPTQTRQQAKQKGVTVATITDLMKIGDRPIENLQGTTEANINRPRTRLRSRENATSIPLLLMLSK